MNDSVVAFVDQARQYCALIEGIEAPNSWLFAQECLRSVVRLYDRALFLPDTEPTTKEPLDRITHQDWERVRKGVGNRLQRDYYWEVFEPLETQPPEPTAGSLSDDLADIWRDLKVGLLAIDNGRRETNADVVWHWRFSFESHWARHAAGAIIALNALCYGQFADPNRP